MASSFHCAKETMMMYALLKWERRARYLMGIVAVLSIMAVILYKTGLVSTGPSYDDRAWYSFSRHAGVVIFTEHGTEAACRSAEKLPEIVCHSGKSLLTGQSKDPTS
jgi:hypothetical protein